jgi:hypothetical protein
MMSNAVFDKLVWSLIYGGLVVASLSLFVARQETGLAWVLGIAGVLATFAGSVLIVVRARRRDAPQGHRAVVASRSTREPDRP